MAKHLIIRGRVQGVGYRAAMCEEAIRRGAKGWVRNCRDGTVEAVVDGDPAAVAGVIEWARVGPPGARVTGVTVTETADAGYDGFDWRPTT